MLLPSFQGWWIYSCHLLASMYSRLPPGRPNALRPHGPDDMSLGWPQSLFNTLASSHSWLTTSHCLHVVEVERRPLMNDCRAMHHFTSFRHSPPCSEATPQAVEWNCSTAKPPLRNRPEGLPTTTTSRSTATT